jgi:hypothetical protein
MRAFGTFDRLKPVVQAQYGAVIGRARVLRTPCWSSRRANTAPVAQLIRRFGCLADQFTRPLVM